MGKGSFMLLAGAVVLTAGIAAPGIAQAQETVTERRAARAEVPWYERFTYSQAPADQTPALGPVDRRGERAWAPTTRWGVTVDLSNAERTVLGPVEGDETSVGAYYQFTPSVRVGGQVSVGTRREPLAAITPAQREREPAAGVRLESAFRF